MPWGSAEKCAACGKSVYVTEKAVVDLADGKKSFHKMCLKCSVCSQRLEVGSVVIIENKLFCRTHSQREGKEILARSASQKGASLTRNESASKFSSNIERCGFCDKAVYATEKITIDISLRKENWHKTCLRCKHCNKSLTLGTYVTQDGSVFCKPHHKELSSLGVKLSPDVDTHALLAEKIASVDSAARSTSAGSENVVSEHLVSPSGVAGGDSSDDEKAPAAAKADSDSDSEEDEEFMKRFGKHMMTAESHAVSKSAAGKATDEDLAAQKEKALEKAKAPKIAASELAGGDKKLKHVDTQEIHDASAPATEGAKVGTDSKEKRDALLGEVAAGADLKKVDADAVHDASAPATEGAQVRTDGKEKRGELLSEIQGDKSLKATEDVHDASAPKLPKAAKPGDTRKVIDEIGKGKALKHVDTQEIHDASSPATEGAKVGTDSKTKHDALLGEVAAGADLKKVDADAVHDASAPATEGAQVRTDGKEKRGELLGEIEAQKDWDTPLKAAEDVHDASAPRLPKAAKPGDTRKVIDEIGKGKALKHVDTQEIHDASAPATEGAKVGTDSKAKHDALLGEVAAGADLKKVDTQEIHDASAPATDGASVKADAHYKRGALLNEIEDKGSEVLTAVEDGGAVDKSAPKLPKAAKPSDTRAVIEEIGKGGKGLKPVKDDEIHDASAPNTEGASVKADAHYKRGALLNEIEDSDSGKQALKHVDTQEIHDASAPATEGASVKADAHYKRGALLNEIEDKGANKEESLNTPDSVKDASAPRLPKATKKSDVDALMGEVKEKGEGAKQGLKHVATAEIHDASVPATEGAEVKADAHYKRGALLNEIEDKGANKEEALKPVSDADKKDASAPATEGADVKANAHYKHGALLQEVEAGGDLKAAEPAGKAEAGGDQKAAEPAGKAEAAAPKASPKKSGPKRSNSKRKNKGRKRR